MALVYMDSFDHYATSDLIDKGWTPALGGSGSPYVQIQPAASRSGFAGLRCSSTYGGSMAWAYRGVANSGPFFVIGVAMRTLGAPGGPWGTAFIGIMDGVTQLSLVLLGDLRMRVMRGGASSGSVILVDSQSPVLQLNSYVYVEFRGRIDPTVGFVEVRVNGVVVITTPATLNTRATANSAWGSFRIGHEAITTAAVPQEWDFDDLYVLDGTGGPPWDAPLGDSRVDALVPTGPGAYTEWTPSTGNNWDAVNDIPANDEADYNHTMTTGVRDLFATQDAPATVTTVHGVQHCMMMRKTDAGPCTVAPLVRYNGQDRLGTNLAPSSTYTYGVQVMPKNPVTDLPWTVAEVNATEFGYQRTG